MFFCVFLTVILPFFCFFAVDCEPREFGVAPQLFCDDPFYDPYVADGHMPLHITRNYNGQYSGNHGIHSRYESNMIDEFENEISYDGQEIHCINDVRNYVFTYLYQNYTYVDSILLAGKPCLYWFS